MIKAVIVALALAGCTTLDEEVDVYGLSATISLQPSAPDALADVELTLRIAARSRADHEIALDSVGLAQPDAEYQTDIAMNPFTPFWIHPGQSEEVTLANVGTTNAELGWLCGAPASSSSTDGTTNLHVVIDYLETLRPNGGVRGNWTDAQAAVTCR
ncbi:MAG TPA: hypothetical protein VMJ10_31465 [Kofleriaceae bacterium]|nr:hypothetical protein [Kofleriaceae bacterium]